LSACSTARAGAVLAEVIIVLFIIAMFTTIAMINLSDVLNKNSFKNRAHDLVKLFQMAATSSSETGRRYEIIIDFVRNSYTLREITTGLVAVEDIKEEEIIQTGQFSDRFQLSYVMFDDGDWTNEAPALFRVGKTGWQYGGKIVVADEDGREYSIVINRLSRMIDLFDGDMGILIPRSEDEMGF
jgi:type II secretory pathway pseudopilin PulG